MAESTGAPKAIPTTYDGYRFRSRLEARWAVYFNAINHPYQYEKEGFDLPEVGYYLPDFYFPSDDTWGEVKGRAFTEKEIVKCQALVKATGRPCMLFTGLPGEGSHIIMPPEKPTVPLEAVRLYTRLKSIGVDLGCRGGYLQADVTSIPDELVQLVFEYEGELYAITAFEKQIYDVQEGSGLPSRGFQAARSARFEFGEKGAE